MTPYQLVLLAGAVGTFVIIWQNWLSFHETRPEVEDKLRERLEGRGGKENGITVAVDEIRIYKLSWWSRLKWYFGRGIDSSVEIKLKSNVEATENAWNAVEKSFNESDTDFPKIEFLDPLDPPRGEIGHSVIKINSTKENDIMSIVCALPVLFSTMDLSPKLDRKNPSSPTDLPNNYEEKLDNLT